MEENRDTIRICACCGDEIDIEEDDYSLVENDILCRTCTDNECGVCDHCEERVYIGTFSGSNYYGSVLSQFH